MAYQIAFTPAADAVRRTLPMTARVTLRTKLTAIARDPSNHGRSYGAGQRVCPFGRSDQGLVVYIDDQRKLITVTRIVWAK
jgi:mRNA-degrading endonuclease RelE of RelBE toxin-antitoxin system